MLRVKVGKVVSASTNLDVELRERGDEWDAAAAAMAVTEVVVVRRRENQTWSTGSVRQPKELRGTLIAQAPCIKAV